MFNSRSFARKKMAEAYRAKDPECYKCHRKMFILADNRFYTEYRCAICGETRTIRKRG
jgi:hypothetical protein